MSTEKMDRSGGSQKSRVSSTQPKSKGTFMTKVSEPGVQTLKQNPADISKQQNLPSDTKGCIYCSGPYHAVLTCELFAAQPYADRIHYLKSKGLCFGCVCHGHMVKKCKGRLTCSKCVMSPYNAPRQRSSL